jgi:tetratricopeptide (TPR) repeat protein
MVGKYLFLILITCGLLSPVYALGERPKPRAQQNAAPKSESKTLPGVKEVQIEATVPSADPTANETVKLTEDELADAEKSVKESLTQRQFMQALTQLEGIPTAQRSPARQAEYQKLMLFKQAETEASKNNTLFQKEDDLDEATKKNIQKLYRESQWEFLQGKTELSRDLLIQILFLDRRNAKARKMLEVALQLKVGDYKVEDIEEKYWNKSSVSFYGGNYAAAVESLNILVFFDKENPLVYERMGSAYHMMGETQKAIESWNTALFFKPGNTALKEVIEKAKKAQAEQAEEQKRKSKEKKKSDTAQVADAELQLMGLYKTQGEAYNAAGELKKRNLDPIVEEQDNGKWAVKVPKSQLQKK